MQALDTIKSLEEELQRCMTKLDIRDENVFKEWHAEEAAYLQSLKSAPKVNQLAIEYVKLLQKLAAAK